MWIKATGIFFALLFVVFVFVMGAQSQWQRRSQQLVDVFYQHDAAASSVEVYRPEQELDGLPEPVAAYFRKVLRPGQPLVQALTLEQNGAINLAPKADAWKAFSARQDILPQASAFIWLADVSMAPGIRTFVLERFSAGEGQLQARMAGLITVASQSGTGAIAEGELMRFLAEAPWYPTRLLPSQGIRWQAIDEQQAMATLKAFGKTVSLVFTFNDAGFISSVMARERFRQHINGQPVHAPWRGDFSDYRDVSGMLVPHRAEVFWQIGGQWHAYWQGSVKSWAFRFRQSALPRRDGN